MSDFPTKAMVGLGLALAATFGAWFWYDAEGGGGTESGQQPKPRSGVKVEPASVSDGEATVSLADPTLRLVFRGPDDAQNHVIRVGDLPETQRRCVQLHHPRLPDDQTFLADLVDQGISAEDDTATSDLTVRGRKVPAGLARSCSDAAWKGSELGVHIRAFTYEFAKHHPDSNRAEASDSATEVLE